VIEPQACVAIEDVEHLADARGPLLLPARWYGLPGRTTWVRRPEVRIADAADFRAR